MSENVKLPDGWKRVRLGEVIERIGDGGTPPRSDKTNFDGDIPWVVIEDIKKRIYDTKEKLTKKGLKHSNAKIWKKGSIILSFGATIGVVGIAEVDLATKQGIAGIELKNDEVFNLFLYFVLTTKKNELLRLANQTTILEVRPNVFVNKLSFLLPPLPEQRKIAEILETIDNAIEKTDAIIEKYKRIKQGLMQDLLTKGIDENWQIRSEKTHKFKDTPLGRIPVEWEVVRLKDIADIRVSNVDKKINLKEKIVRLCNYMEVYQHDYITQELNFMYASATNNEIKKFKVSKGDVIITKDSEEFNDIARPSYVKDEIENLVCGYHLALIKPQNNVDGLFLSKILGFRKINVYFQKRANGITRFGLTKESIDNAIIFLPPLPEQQRIASILSQIDEVIEKEQAYKEKLERIKKGLMEDLLTGKVRVNHLIEEENKDGN